MNFRKVWFGFWLILILSILIGGFLYPIYSTPDESEEMDLLKSRYYDEQPQNWEMVIKFSDNSLMFYVFDSYKQMKESVNNIIALQKQNGKGKAKKILFRRVAAKNPLYYSIDL